MTPSPTTCSSSASPTRSSLRHFPQMLDVIMNRMGTEPHLPQWPLIATDIIAVEFGKLTTGGHASTQEGMDQIKRLADEAAAS